MAAFVVIGQNDVQHKLNKSIIKKPCKDKDMMLARICHIIYMDITQCVGHFLTMFFQKQMKLATLFLGFIASFNAWITECIYCEIMLAYIYVVHEDLQYHISMQIQYLTSMYVVLWNKYNILEILFKYGVHYDHACMKYIWLIFKGSTECKFLIMFISPRSILKINRFW